MRGVKWLGTWQMEMRSPLAWIGGKHFLAAKLIDLMPAHVCYVEPFGGGAHVLIQKYSSTNEVYNDINGDVVNFFMVLRQDPDRLYKACASLPYARALFDRWRKEPLPEDNFERAVRFFYLNRSCISGDMRYPGWKHSKQKENPASYYQSACDLISKVAKRMSRVQIECRDFRYIIKTYDSPTTLFYCDPPYVGLEKYYAGNFTEKDHRDLAQMLQNIEGKAMVSYYSHPLVDELCPGPGWHREEIIAAKFSQGPVRTNAVAQRTRATELVLMNYKLPLRLFAL